MKVLMKGGNEIWEVREMSEMGRDEWWSWLDEKFGSVGSDVLSDCEGDGDFLDSDEEKVLVEVGKGGIMKKSESELLRELLEVISKG